MIYKRNHARGGNIKQWRDEQKLRTLPKKPEDVPAWIGVYADKNWPKAVTRAVISVLEERWRNNTIGTRYAILARRVPIT